MKKRRGFSFFEVAILLLAVVVVGMIAIPGVLMQVREQDEVRAVEFLRKVALAEHRRRHAKPVAAYGSLDDLVAEGLLEDADLEMAGSGEEPLARVGGYYFAVFLPDEEGRPVPASRASAVGSDRAFLAIAWPVRAGETGYRTYAVNEDLLLWQARDRDPARSGSRLPDPGISRIGRGPGVALPEPWTLLLPEITAPETIEAVIAAGLPVPPALQNVVDTEGK